MADFPRTALRLRGEVGLHRRCNPGEGVPDYQRTLPSRIEPLTPTLSPRRAGRGSAPAAWREMLPYYGYFFTVFAGPFGAGIGAFFTGLLAAASAAVLMSSISFETRAALLPRSPSK